MFCTELTARSHGLALSVKAVIPDLLGKGMTTDYGAGWLQAEDIANTISFAYSQPQNVLMGTS